MKNKIKQNKNKKYSILFFDLLVFISPITRKSWVLFFKLASFRPMFQIQQFLQYFETTCIVIAWIRVQLMIKLMGGNKEAFKFFESFEQGKFSSFIYQESNLLIIIREAMRLLVNYHPIPFPIWSKSNISLEQSCYVLLL